MSEKVVTTLFIQTTDDHYVGRSGCLYNKEQLQKQMTEFLNNKSNCYGEFNRGEDSDTTTSLVRISHKITDFKFEGDNVVAEAEILDTPCGQVTMDFIQNKIPLHIVPRLYGTVETLKDGTKNPKRLSVYLF